MSAHCSLNPKIETQIQLPTMMHGLNTLNIFNNTMAGINQNSFLTFYARQVIVERPLYAFLTVVIDVRKSNNVSNQRARRVVTPIFPLGSDTADTQLLNLLRFVWWEVPTQIDEFLVGRQIYLAVDLVERDFQRSGESFQVRSGFSEFSGICCDRVQWCTDGQDLTLSIGDDTPHRLNWKRSDLPDFSLTSQLTALKHLNLKCSGEQPHEPQQHHRKAEPVSPRVEFLPILEQLAHLELSSLKTTVSWGSGGTMPSFCRASNAIKLCSDQVACSS